jgi:hypothetical protein
MFGNFAKIGRAAGASPIWQISKHHEYYSLIVRATSHDYLFIISMTKLDTYFSVLNVNIIFSRQSPVLPDFQPKFGAFVCIFI